MKFTTP